jgi:hypothetical protein
MYTRKALRQRFNIQEDCDDCVVTTFCAAQSNAKVLKTRALARNSDKLACTRKNFAK